MSDREKCPVCGVHVPHHGMYAICPGCDERLVWNGSYVAVVPPLPEEDKFECPRCHALVGRLEMPLHAYDGIGTECDTGFEWVASCPHCDEARRKT